MKNHYNQHIRINNPITIIVCLRTRKYWRSSLVDLLLSRLKKLCAMIVSSPWSMSGARTLSVFKIRMIWRWLARVSKTRALRSWKIPIRSLKRIERRKRRPMRVVTDRRLLKGKDWRRRIRLRKILCLRRRLLDLRTIWTRYLGSKCIKLFYLEHKKWPLTCCRI